MQPAEKPKITAGQRKALDAIAAIMSGEPWAECFHKSVKSALETAGLIEMRLDASLSARLVGCNSFSPRDFDLTEAGAAAIGRALAPCDDCSTPASCSAVGACVRDEAEPVAALPLQDGEIAAELVTEPPTPVALRRYFSGGWPGYEIRFLVDLYGHKAGDTALYGVESIRTASRVPDGWSAVLDAVRDRRAAFFREEPSTFGRCCCVGAPPPAAPAMVPQVCQQQQANASREWISPRDRLPPEGQTIEISVLANSLDVSTGKRLGNDWYLDRRYGGSVLMGEPSVPAYWRPVARAPKAAA